MRGSSLSLACTLFFPLRVPSCSMLGVIQVASTKQATAMRCLYPSHGAMTIPAMLQHAAPMLRAPNQTQAARLEEERRAAEEEAAKIARKQAKMQEETARKAEDAEKVRPGRRGFRDCGMACLFGICLAVGTALAVE